MSARDQTLIADWQARLRDDALAARVLSTLIERKSEVQRCALDGLQRENPQFSRAASAEFREQAVGHCDAILELMLAIANARTKPLGYEPFRFVERHATQRARQQFPLAGSLSAYRIAHKAYWEVMRNSVATVAAPEGEKTDCLIVLSEFLLEFFDRLSGIMTDAYIAEEKRLIARGARTQAALMEDLLHGRQPGDLEAQALWDLTGIRDRATMAVAIGRVDHSLDGNEASHARSLENMSRSFGGALAASEVANLIDIRKEEVVAIVGGPKDISKVAARALRGAALEHGFRCGVSLDASDISSLPQALQEAERAVVFTDANRPVMHFGDIGLIEFLVRHPDAAAQRLIPGWAGRLREADVSKSGELSRTIRQFAASNLNVKRTARDLNLHTNTVYFRLNSVRNLTGIDPRSYQGLSLLLTTLEMLDTPTLARRQ